MTSLTEYYVMKTPAKSKSTRSKNYFERSGVTSDQQTEIIQLLNEFLQWLMAGKVIQSLSHTDHIVDLPFANEDWVMRVDEKKRTVSFNTYVTEKCSFGYFKSIFIHELFHLVVQKVPNKEDAVQAFQNVLEFLQSMPKSVNFRSVFPNVFLICSSD